MTRAVVLLSLLLAAAPTAANPHLERANEALDDLEFDEARGALDAALRAGDNDPSELAEIHMLSGIVAASFGDAAAAREAFRRLLSIDPQATLGGGLAPKIVAPFEAAQRSLDEGLIARYEPYAYGDEELIVVIESDPADLVAGVRVLYRDAEGDAHRLRADGRDQIAVALPALPAGKVKIGVVDEHGNRLFVMAWDAPEPPVEDAPDAEPELEVELEAPAPPAKTRPRYATWKVWAGASVGLIGAGTYFGLKTRADQRDFDEILSNSEDYEYEDAVAVLDRGNRHAMFANIAFGAAVVTSAVSAYLYLRERDDERPSVTPVPVRGGAAVSWEVSF